MKKLSGFTLIELMIVIAIIGILSTMALPSYQDRVIRAQVNEGIELARFIKDDISDYYKSTKRLPVNNEKAGLPPADKIIGNFVTAIAVDHGSIQITFGNNANKFLSGKILSLRPAIVAQYPAVPISWICGKAAGIDKMEIIGANNTDLPVPHLPLDCRPR